MTYHFFCRYFKPRVAEWITALWFAVLFMILFAFSIYDEGMFTYINF